MISVILKLTGIFVYCVYLSMVLICLALLLLRPINNIAPVSTGNVRPDDESCSASMYRSNCSLAGPPQHV